MKKHNSSLDNSQNFALEASAGTGKTFQLSMRVAGMLLTGVPIQDILCLTFTNKAKEEMLERIVLILHKISQGKGEKSQTEPLIELLKFKTKNYDYNITLLEKDAKFTLEKLLEEFSLLKVKTIDSFSSSILKLFPFEANMRPDYAQLSNDDDEIIELQTLAFYSVMESLLEDKEWKEIFSLFAEVMESNRSKTIENLLGFATFVSERRVELQIPIKKNILTPKAILSTLKEAREKRKQILSNINTLGQLMGKADGLIDRQRKVCHKLTQFNSLKDAVKETAFQKHITEHSFFIKFKFTSAHIELYEKITEDITKYLTLKSQSAKALALSLGSLVYKTLYKLKNEKNVFTYQDITERAYDILVENMGKNFDKEYLYFRLDARINHILIDEFQDTSVTQWEILRPLAEEAMSGVGQYDKQGSFFYVGDPKQNLYRFRGGSSALFSKIALNDYPDKITYDSLDINYRSDKNIVETVNLLFNGLADLFNIPDSQIFKIHQKTTDDRADGYVSIEYSSDENADFADFTLDKIKKALKAGFDYSHIAVLVPSNDDGTKIMEKLLEASIPVRLETSGKLASSKVFLATVALAEFIETKDEFSFLQYSMMQNPAFSPEKYAHTPTREKIKNHILNIAAEKSGKTIFEKLVAVAIDQNLQARFNEPDFIQTFDLIANCATDETNIALFKETVTKAAFNMPSLTAAENNAVTVMTVHKSKGLQFPCVILPKLDFGTETNNRHATFVTTENNEHDGTFFEFVHSVNFKKFLDEKQKNALDMENENVTQDSLNKLYVAFTRAEQAIMARVEITKPTSQAKKLSKIIPQVLEIPYEAGTLTPHRKESKPSENSISVNYSFCCAQTKGVFKEETEVDYKSAAFGAAFHAGAFLLDGFTPHNVENACHMAFASYGAILDTNEKNIIEKYLQLLADEPKWQELFKGKVFRERKIAKGNTLYSIDFYSVIENEIILIDYKTGEINEETLQIYTAQLENYASLLKKLHKLNVRKYLYHFHKNSLKILEY